MKKQVLFLISILGCLGTSCAEYDCGEGLCSEHYGVSSEYSVTQAGLEAKCTINVSGSGTKNIETDYVPNVTWCENGNSNTEGLRAQAVAARSFARYKGNSVGDGQSDQVYSCPSRAPNSEQLGRTKAATNATAGIVLRYNNTNVCTFYVSGSTVGNLDSECKTTSTAWPQSNVTYNWGKSGSGITQSSLGWVSSGNYANRGCMSQNGATCLGNKGWVWENIVRFFYGMDIEIVHTTGSCVTHPDCQTKVSNGTVIDDTDECFVRTAMDRWYVLSSGNGGSSQFAYTSNGSASSYGVWTVNVVTAGTYEILANIDAGHGSRSRKAPYTVRAKGVEKTVNVDISGSGWISLGKFEFAAGGDQWVKLTDATGEAYTDGNGKRVVFDALKFVSASACTDACSSSGTKMCSGNGFQTCSDSNNDGCLEWSGVTDCGSGKTCSGAGECIESCSNECAEGTKQCSGNSAYVECGNFDEDSCLEWSPTPSACGNGEICSNGECVTNCTNACVEGTLECLDDTTGYRVCQMNSGTSCTEWGETKICEEGTYCSAGSCISVPESCEDECVAEGSECNAENDGFRVCGNYDPDSCLEWSPFEACTGEDVCRNGRCVDPDEKCEDACQQGEKVCEGDGVKVCRTNDDDVCLGWSDVVPCGADETCQNGECKGQDEDVECLTEIDGRPSTIIDDSDGCFERSSPDSAFWMTLPEGYQNNLYYAYVKDNSDAVTGIWHLNVTKEGEYTIQVHVPGGVGSVREIQEYTVYAAGKKHYPTVAVDEDSSWLTLGKYELKKGTSQYVMMSSRVEDESELRDEDGNEIRVLFDAIKVISNGEGGSESDDVDSETPDISIVAAAGCSMNGKKSGESLPIGVILLIFGMELGVFRRRLSRYL